MFERQTDQLLFPKILWNRPISRATAGRLLLVGGHQSGVATLQASYQVAQAAGIGALTVLAPETLRPLLGAVPDVEFTASTHSGSLAKSSLGTLQEKSSHADATLIGLDASNNSETIILFEKFIESFHQPLVISDDGLELIAQAPDLIRGRGSTLVILTMQQLFKLAGKLDLPLSIKPDSGLTGKVEILEQFWNVIKVGLALVGPEVIIKVGQQVSVTPLPNQPASLLPTAYGVLSVCYTQNPKALYEGLTTGAFLIKEAIASAADASFNEVCASLTKTLTAHED